MPNKKSRNRLYSRPWGFGQKIFASFKKRFLVFTQKAAQPRTPSSKESISPFRISFSSQIKSVFFFFKMDAEVNGYGRSFFGVHSRPTYFLLELIEAFG